MNKIFEYPSSAIAYCIVILSATALAALAKRNEKKRIGVYTIVLVVLLSLFCGLRSESVGTDTSHYIEMQRQLQSGSFGAVWGEAGFKLLVLLTSMVPIYNFTLIVCAFISIGFVIVRLWELKDNFDFTMSVFIYCTYYYFHSFNIVRQCVTMAVVFWATGFLDKRKPKTYILIIVIMLFFHSSAIFGLLFLGLYILKYEGLLRNKVRNVALIIMSVLVFCYAVNNSDLRLGRLLTKYALTANLSFEIMPIFRLCLFLIFEFLGITVWFRRPRNVNNSHDNNPIFIFTKITYVFGMVIGIIITWFSPRNADRIAIYFRQYEMLYYGSKEECRNLQIIKKMVYVLFSLLSLYFTLSAGRYGIMPYSMFD